MSPRPSTRSLESLAGLAAIASLIACTGASHAAENYPSKPGRLILPFGAGASTDTNRKK